MNRDEYDEYLNSLISYLEFVSNTEDVQQILHEQDMKELEISKLPCYNSLEELMKSVKEI